jgi:hypothetical protein
MSAILKLIGSIGFFIMLLLWEVGPRAETNATRPDDCLAQPNSGAPAGSHWYYHVERATQRKCWYMRVLDGQAQHPDVQTQVTTSIPIPTERPVTASPDAPMPLTPDAGASPQPHIKMLTVVSSGATNKLDQQTARQNTWLTAGPGSEEGTSQTNDVASEPARAAATVAADLAVPPMQMAQDPSATPDAVPTDVPVTKSIRQPTSDARATPGEGSTTAQAGASPKNESEPLEMFLVASAALLTAGFLFQIAVKIASARRRKIIVDQRESHWMDDPDKHELRNEQQRVGSVHQKDELVEDFVDHPEPHWTDERNEQKRDGGQLSGLVRRRDRSLDQFQGSVITTSDNTSRRPIRNEWQQGQHHKDRDVSDIADEIGTREDTLEQLRRDLDRLLRSPKVA